jgi:tetratricopeptide (TPR) repeat protein
MTAPDLCPDHLVARALRGTSSAVDQRALERHLASCEVCSAACDVAGALAAEPSALAGDAQLLERIAARALAAGTRPLPTGVRRPGRARRPRRALVAAVAVVALAAAGAAAALRARDRLEPPPSGAARPRPAPPAKKAMARPAPVEPLAPAAPPPAMAPVEPVETAARLFRRAARARDDGETERALALFRRLQTRWPGSPQAALSHVSAGNLVLAGNGDPRAALAAFEAHLARPAPALREEALYGRARALRRLGEPAREREAWRQLVEAAPDGPYVGRARQRLDELGEPR